MKQVLRIGLTLILLVLGGIYLAQHQDQLSPLLHVSVTDVTVIITVLCLFFITTGITFQLLISLFSVRLSFNELIGLTLLTNLVNYITPGRPGAAVKAIYLKGEKELPYALFSSVLVANGFIVLLLAGICGLMILLYFHRETGLAPPELYLVCVALISISVLPFVLHLPRFNDHGVIKQTLNRSIEGFDYIKIRKPILVYVSLSILTQYVVSAVLMITTYQALGYELSLTGALMIGVFTAISNLFTITPNNLGIQEFVMAYLATITGMDFSTGLLGAGLIRAAHITITIVLTPIFTYFMLKKTNMTFADIMPFKRQRL